ncbi:MAG: asparaginase [Lachnospiraceae bacterium]|nr:asparaginase [Lachnospiraceae bacterium]
MKKILVILTGGTIGSKVSSKDIDVDTKAAYSLITKYQENYERETEFEVLSPYQVLSENIDLEYWMKLYETINRISYEDYEGIIVTHGSDTLSYTSNFLGYLFARVPIPIILIASNYALTDSKSNGLLNFKTSVDFIKEKKGTGVFTIFSNDKGEVPVYCATNIKESDPYLDQFLPFDGTYYDVKTNYRWLSECNNEKGQRKEGNKGKEEKDAFLNDKKNDFCLFQNDLKLEKRVLGIRIYPGLDFDVYDLTNVNAVLCYLYHSATASIEGTNTSILRFIQRCKEKGIPVFAASFKSGEKGGYVTKNEILRAGATPLYDLSFESAYMKLLIGINQSQMDLFDWMTKETSEK